MKIEVIRVRRGGQKEIARVFNISKSAVSEILNGSVRYNKEITRRVRYVAMNEYEGKRLIIMKQEVCDD